MLDLTCESPQCFNIRHPERGVLTRSTKRPGNNLHCIMAFTMQESGEWGALLGDNIISPEPPKFASDSSSRDGHTPIETLASSESDFPRDVGEVGSDGGRDGDGVDTLRRGTVPDYRGWSDGSNSPSNSLERGSAPDKPSIEW